MGQGCGADGEHDLVQAFVAYIREPDLDGAVAFLTSLLAGGMAAADVITGILVPAQVHVGERWRADAWSVADEHAASAVTAAALAALSHQARPLAAAPRRRRLVFGCIDGEWHGLAAQMAAELLQLSGFGVDFLGASVPASDLRRYLVEQGAVACGLSCSTWSSLAGARRTIAAAHEAAVPVIVGGRAWGDSGRRAEAVGADAWSPTCEGAVAILRSWEGVVPTLASPEPCPAEAMLLEAPDPVLLRDAVDALFVDHPPLAGFADDAVEQIQQIVRDILRHAAAALAVDDPLLFVDYVDWLVGFARPRGLEDVLRKVLPATRKALGPEYRGASLLLSAACDELDL